MMNHEHNPIAIRINKLQQKWYQETERHPDYSLARWLIHSEDVDFINGFLKLESSPHGQLTDIFVVLFTPFVTAGNYAKAIITDWIEMYKAESVQQETGLWNFSIFEEKLQASRTAGDNELLLEMLHDFSRYASNGTRPLVVSLIPRSIADNNDYSKWIQDLIGNHEIAASVKFAILDFEEHNYFIDTTTIPDRKTIDLNPGNLNMREAISQLASQGNPNDPEVQFRTCMMKMGEATGANNRKALDEWGEKLLNAAQRSGNKGMWASAHLIYGGFLMHFPAKEETRQMLQNALELGKKALHEDTNNVTILLQVYGYLGALESMNGDHKAALGYFEKQADLAVEYELNSVAISTYKTIIYLCRTHKYNTEYEAYVEKGYQLGLHIPDEELKVTDYGFIAYHYIDLNYYTHKDEVSILWERMDKLFGKNWKEDLQSRLDEAQLQQH